MQDMLRFITCGSVDDGKSTLIGRLLYDSKKIFQDQLSSIEKESKKYGTVGDDIDLALLVDGLQNEREQGITIDVAYRYFSTDIRKFIIADTPGHEQYTRNMVTGASTADLALILIDATKGVLTQTKRHSYIVSLLGIKDIVVVINKMDLVKYSQEKYEDIKREYKSIISKLPNYESINFSFIPVSALNGDNIVKKSLKMPWYKEDVLMQILQSVKVSQSADTNSDFRFLVQYVNRPDANFRGFCGSISSGSIRVGDQIMVLPTKKTTKVKSIILPSVITQKLVDEAFAPMAVTITTEDEIDICRGDMFIKEDSSITISDELEVMIVWMSETPLDLDKQYIIKRATTSLTGRFTSINYKINADTFKQYTTDKVGLNEIIKATLKLDEKIAADTYKENRLTGSFVIIDKYTNDTLGAGMITSSKKEKKSSFKIDKEHSQKDKELNAFIRKHYPDWQCKSI